MILKTILYFGMTQWKMRRMNDRNNCRRTNGITNINFVWFGYDSKEYV